VRRGGSASPVRGGVAAQIRREEVARQAGGSAKRRQREEAAARGGAGTSKFRQPDGVMRALLKFC
jgi:hypothetical protein